MEGLGAFPDGECDSFSGMFSAFSRDESVGDLCISSNLSFEANMNMCESWFSSLCALNSGLHECDHQSGCSFLLADNTRMAMDIDMPELKIAEKRLRDSKDKIPKNAFKKIRSDGSVEEGKSSSGCSSEDDIASPQTPSAPALIGKMRASTGPQSLYARKRREKINERLRTLQSLVPNGTKVDMSTMLEEAVHYVKFLELQIKLLSSDDMWMYSPIAYNGMDIGHNRNTSQ